MPVVVDIETGGFNSQTDAILEIAAVVIAMNADGYLEIEQSLFHRVIPFEGANLEEAALKFTASIRFTHFGSHVQRRTSSRISLR